MARMKKTGDSSAKTGEPSTRQQAAELAHDVAKADVKITCDSAADSETELNAAKEQISKSDNVREEQARQMEEQQALITDL